MPASCESLTFAAGLGAHLQGSGAIRVAVDHGLRAGEVVDLGGDDGLGGGEPRRERNGGSRR